MPDASPSHSYYLVLVSSSEIALMVVELLLLFLFSSQRFPIPFCGQAQLGLGCERGRGKDQPSPLRQFASEARDRSRRCKSRNYKKAPFYFYPDPQMLNPDKKSRKCVIDVRFRLPLQTSAAKAERAGRTNSKQRNVVGCCQGRLLNFQAIDDFELEQLSRALAPAHLAPTYFPIWGGLWCRASTREFSSKFLLDGSILRLSPSETT